MGDGSETKSLSRLDYIERISDLESQLATATAELVKIKGRCAEYAEDLRISQAAKQAAEGERDETREVLACATDIANSWARELGGVTEAESESGLRALVDRLWGVTSSRYFGMKGNYEDALSEGKQALERAEAERDSLRAQLAEARNRALEEAAELILRFDNGGEPIMRKDEAAAIRALKEAPRG